MGLRFAARRAAGAPLILIESGDEVNTLKLVCLIKTIFEAKNEHFFEEKHLKTGSMKESFDHNSTPRVDFARSDV